jgi:hypothetical protein
MICGVELGRSDLEPNIVEPAYRRPVLARHDDGSCAGTRQLRNGMGKRPDTMLVLDGAVIAQVFIAHFQDLDWPTLEE